MQQSEVVSLKNLSVSKGEGHIGNLINGTYVKMDVQSVEPVFSKRSSPDTMLLYQKDKMRWAFVRSKHAEIVRVLACVGCDGVQTSVANLIGSIDWFVMADDGLRASQKLCIQRL